MDTNIIDFLNDDDSFKINFEYCNFETETWSNFSEPELNFETPYPTQATDDATNVDISISTAFHPSANIKPGEPIDLILSSNDTVFFYVHTSHVFAASSNCLNMLALLPYPTTTTTTTTNAPKAKANQQDTYNHNLVNQSQDQIPGGTACGQSQIVHIPERATVLNIILHAIYELPIASYAPAVDDIIVTLDVMPKYGISVQRYAAPGTELANILLANAPLYPLEVYALASAHGLKDLAQRASPHLLSCSLMKISDGMAEKMGAAALKNLFLLHTKRVDALKRLLYTPPYPHGPTPECDFAEQKKLTRAWALASSYLVWEARPDLSGGAIESAMKNLGDAMPCELCKESLGKRVKEVVVQWSLVKRTV